MRRIIARLYCWLRFRHMEEHLLASAWDGADDMVSARLWHCTFCKTSWVDLMAGGERKIISSFPRHR